MKVWRQNGSTETQQISLRVPVVNERESPFGTGWSMPGLMRLYDQGDGVYITQGDGTGLWFEKNASGAYVSPAGDFSRLMGNGSGWTRHYPDSTRAEFGNSGYLDRMRDRFGNTTSFGYDISVSPHRLASIADPAGKQITFGYSGGAVSWIRDPNWRTAYTSRSGNIVWQFFDPDGPPGLDLDFETTGPTLLGYWERGAGRGAETGWRFGYDAHGALASITAPQVNTTDAGLTRPTTTLRSLQAAVLPAPGTGTAISRAAWLLSADVRVEATDPKGNTTRMKVDRFGLPTRIEEPLGRTTTFSRDTLGRVTQSVAPSGHLVHYEYTGINLTQIVDDSTGAVVNYRYEPTYSLPDSIWGSTTPVRNFYGAQGQLDSTRVAGKVTRYTFTTRGRVKTVTDPEGHGTTFTYGDEDSSNGWGNLHHVESGVSTVRRTTYTYDDYGRQVMVINPASDTTRVAYNLLNWTDSTTNAAHGVTRYAYHANGTLYQVTDPKNQTYTFNRNALGWVESEVDPRNQWMYYGYDRNGNQTSHTNRRNQTVTAGYDALDRIVSRYQQAEAQQTTWSYGNYAESDRWMRVQNGVSTDSLAFDAAGRPIRAQTTRGGTTYTLQSSFNERSLRTQVQTIAPWVSTVQYRYNARMQLDTLIDRMGGRTRLAYNDDGQEILHTLPTGL